MKMTQAFYRVFLIFTLMLTGSGLGLAESLMEKSESVLDVWSHCISGPDYKDADGSSAGPFGPVPLDAPLTKIKLQGRMFTDPSLLVFPAKKEGALTGAILVIGGANLELIKDLNAHGKTVFVLHYLTTSHRHGTGLWATNREMADRMDVQRAVSLVRSLFPQYNLGHKAVGVMAIGQRVRVVLDSAANHFARLYHEVDEIDKFSCRPDYWALIDPIFEETRKGHEKADVTFKPEIFRGAPPTFVTATLSCSKNDVVVVQLADAMSRDGVSVASHFYPRMSTESEPKNGAIARRLTEAMSRGWAPVEPHFYPHFRTESEVLPITPISNWEESFESWATP